MKNSRNCYNFINLLLLIYYQSINSDDMIYYKVRAISALIKKNKLTELQLILS